MERAQSYTEVYVILNLMGKDYIEQIPKKLLEMIISEMDKEYKPNINPKIPLSKQNIHKRTYDILGMLKLNYWCNSQEEKEELEQLFKANEEKYQAELREKYKPDNIFKQPASTEIPPTEPVPQEQALVEVKQGFFAKFIDRIKQIFRLK